MVQTFKSLFLLVLMTVFITACSNSQAVPQSPTAVSTSPVQAPTTPPTTTAMPTAEATVIPTALPEPTEIPQTAEQIQAWHEDLDYFKTRLEQIHPDPYYRVPEEEYDQALSQLKTDLPMMSDQEIIVALAQIVAFIDGHSSINLFEKPADFHLYPLHLYLFSDGLFVVNAQDPYTGAIGGRVIQIGKMPVDEALAAVAPYIPHDNEMTIKLSQPGWLIRPEVLLALGIIEEIEQPQYLVEMPDGTQQTLNPTPVTADLYRNWLYVPLAGLPDRPETTYLSRNSEPFWFDYFEESGTLYIQFNSVRAGVQIMANEIETFLEQQEVDRVILDMRLNFGGNNTTYPPLLEFLSSHPQINRPGHFFVITGRQTFSAAANFTTELENQTQAIFVGEPMGGSPNLYGDVIPFVLPNTGLPLRISARYWEKSTPEDLRTTIEPDIPAPLSSQDFFNNHDPALEAILNFDPTEGYRPAYNPILQPLAANEWESADIRDPFIVESDGTYYMFYAGQDANGQTSIGYATSQNGKKWFRSPDNPILSASEEGFDSHGVAAPVVVVEDDMWTLYYAAVSEAGGRSTAVGQAAAETPNGEWTRSSEPLLTTGETPAWDSLSITPGSVLTIDGRQHLYYSGFSDQGQIGIGLAIEEGEGQWLKHDNPQTTDPAFSASDPVLPGAQAGEWDEIVWAPFVQIRDGQWEMFYHGDPISSRGTNEIGIGLATSADGLTWTRPNEPFLTSSSEDRFPHTPNTLSVDDFLYVYYASVENGGTSGQIELGIIPWK